MAEGRVRGFVVTTVCQTVEDFVDRYHGRIEGETLFVSVIEDRVLGGECVFAILLASRQPVLAGMCEVVEVFTNGENRFRRRGMRIAIKRLGVDSERVWAELNGRANRRFPRGSSAPPEQEHDQDQGALLEIDFESLPIEIDEEDTAPLFRRRD